MPTRPNPTAPAVTRRGALRAATASGAPCDAAALLAALTLTVPAQGAVAAADVAAWADLVNRADLGGAQVGEVVAAVLASPALACGPGLFGPGGWLHDNRFNAELLNVGLHATLSGPWVPTLLAACQRPGIDLGTRARVANRVGGRFPFEIKRDFTCPDPAPLFELAAAGATSLVRLADPRQFLKADALPLVVAHPDVTRALASRLLSVQLPPRVAATCTLLLVHPSAGLPASMRGRLMRHLRSAADFNWNSHDAPYAARVFTLVAFAASLDQASGADLSGLDEPALMGWMALHAGMPAVLDEALTYALSRPARFVPTELTGWVFGRPGGNGSPDIQQKIARASSTFALARVNGADPHRKEALLERARAGEGDAYLVLDPDTRRQVGQAAIDTMSWAQLDRGRIGIMEDMVAYAIALAGPVGEHVARTLAPSFRGCCVGDLRGAVAAALSNPAAATPV